MTPYQCLDTLSFDQFRVGTHWSGFLMYMMSWERDKSTVSSCPRDCTRLSLIQVAVCIQYPGKAPSFLGGCHIVTRSPSMHPGDVQQVHAVGKPQEGSPYDIEPLRNCIVFSCKGERPLANCLGGGDYGARTTPSD